MARVTAARSPSLLSHEVAAASADGGGAARGSERCPLRLKTLFPWRRAFLLPPFFPLTAGGRLRECAGPPVCTSPPFSSPCPLGRPELAGAPPAASQPTRCGAGWRRPAGFPGRRWRAAAVGISLLLARFRGRKPNSPACLWVNSDMCECFKAC